ncbi:NAD(P)-binding domain-containing protein, partial [Tanacetum coccineum]
IFVEEDGIATYTIRTIDDPRTLNKTVYIRPPANILSQREIVEIWENLIGKQLEKTSLSEQEFLDSIKEKGYADQAGMTHFYHFFYEGCLANFEIGDDAEEACTLYPDVEYIKVKDYLKNSS